MTNAKEMILLKHCMDTDYREVSLDDAFLEALSLSETRSNEQEIFESNLLNVLKHNPKLLDRVPRKYKVEIVKSWDYEMEKA